MNTGDNIRLTGAGLKLQNGNEIYFRETNEIVDTINQIKLAYERLWDYNPSVSYRNNMIKTAISDIGLETSIDTSVVESLAAIMSDKVKDKNQTSAINMLHMLDTGILDESSVLTHGYIIRIWRMLTDKNRSLEASFSNKGYRKTAVNIYRRGKNVIQNELLYSAPKAVYVPGLMTSLIEFYNNYIICFDQFANTVLKAIVLSAYFVYVHPFLDGNGRTSRLLTTKCLIDGGLSKFRYISYTSEIVKNKKEYGSHLRNIEAGSGGDITRYIEFMLELMLTLLGRLVNRTNGKVDIHMLSDRQKIMINVIRSSPTGTHVKHYKTTWNAIASEKGYPKITVKQAEEDLSFLLLEDLIVIDNRYVRYPGFKYFKYT